MTTRDWPGSGPRHPGATGDRRSGVGTPASAVLQQAQASHQSGHPGEALRLYRQVLDRHPERADVMAAAAAAAFQMGDADQAAELLRSAIARAQDSAPAHCNLGNLLRAQGKPAEAVAAYRRAIEIDPEFAGALGNLGALLEELGRPDEAEATFRDALVVAPGAVEFHDGLGRALAKQTKFHAARAAHNRALELDPSCAPAAFNLANVLQELGETSAAETAYRRTLELAPNYAPALNNFGLLLHKLDRPAEAEACLRRAVAANPDYATARINLATVLFDRGEWAGALAACEVALALEPGNGTALSFKAITLAEMGRPDAARALNNVERFLAKQHLAPPAGHADLAAFNAALTAAVAAVPSRFSEPDATGGRQTRDLMVAPTGPIAEFKILIDDAVGAYGQALAREPDHPFLGRVPDRWRLTAWATLVDEVAPSETTHIHPTAWLSGVYYAAFPESIMADDRPNAGWIEFGRPPSHIRHRAAPQITLVRPEAGLLVLFPSYFYHRVMPFKAAKTRISIAFDVTPED